MFLEYGPQVISTRILLDGLAESRYITYEAPGD